jgi:hypothetical protein
VADEEARVEADTRTPRLKDKHRARPKPKPNLVQAEVG